MKMDFVDEAALAAEETPAGERGKIVLVGEPMGLFMAEAPGELEDVEHFTAAVAGAEYNVAVGLSRLGHTALYCTRLGDDPIGRRIFEEHGGKRRRGRPRDGDGYSPDRLHDEGQHRGRRPEDRVFPPRQRGSQISTHDIDKLDLFGCDFLHVTGIFPAVSKSALEAVKRLMARAKALDMFVSFDPNLRPQLWGDEKEMVRTLNALAAEADLVLPGIHEGKILTKKETAAEIAAFYHDRGVDSVIVKLGADGAYWSTGGESGTVPAFPVKKDCRHGRRGRRLCGRRALGGGRGAFAQRGGAPRHGDRLDPDHAPGRQRGPADARRFGRGGAGRHRLKQDKEKHHAGKTRIFNCTRQRRHRGDAGRGALRRRGQQHAFELFEKPALCAAKPRRARAFQHRRRGVRKKDGHAVRRICAALGEIERQGYDGRPLGDCGRRQRAAAAHVPAGLPGRVPRALLAAVGRGVLCNRPYSGTAVIADYGEEHMKTGKLIVYTSADCVFQIAAHEDVVPLSELYEICAAARAMLTGGLAVGRVIARPFTGAPGRFTRTANRHDYALPPPGETVLDRLKAAGKTVYSIGKIADIF